VSEISIVYEHSDWWLCHKPAGLGFHNEEEELGFISVLRAQLGCDVWPVHRLDKLTSGLILVAKSKVSCAELCQLFSDRLVEKYYLAICPNTLKKKQGKVAGDMAKSRRGSYKLLKSHENPAVTQFFSKSIGSGLRLCLLKPTTGKTHQLRVALKSLGAAVIGDEMYAAKKADRMYLHAYAMRFNYQGSQYEFVLGVDNGEKFNGPEIEGALAEWTTPWALNWPK
jgi:tRNA pseudouridine32 synthase/23S rRNA pseudouridine746 synthase